ncbi:MAG: hydrogenase maturation nickel metallochaperone HypA [Saccharopolyspora sp.]|uniref:hydrogenase maturation nickel metallochaperone HypA/HybF n=1 Tax=Saccharopolyspora TaxID=1835 RepID=UPI00190B0457|nr:MULTISPECIES: hydrogenase maturation nickel metallochaperone HypA [unclassified Saccharopolyspora]MBK0869355.1 hydrogenase maturation nickel metallochaperone HypA [Saccharopolyspora sp. HNM0986]MBQ6643700.1 hydrogenase maturation nickel metallochaperone HypA [Saccharopolyspora sp.]
MHELGITRGVVEAVLDAAGDARIIRLRLEIGRLSGVVTDSVRFCFELAAEGTSLAGARLEITEPGGRAECRACGREFEVDSVLALCSCGSANVALIAGQELRIKEVEVA